MPFSGIHIVCCYAGGRYPGSQSVGEAFLPLPGPPVWSQSMASAGMTTMFAPLERREGFGPPVVMIRTSVDAWVATGPSPVATDPNLPRRLVYASVPEDFFVEPGDRVAWTPA